MKRNMTLIRKILLKVEQNANPNKAIIVSIAGHSDVEVSYHLKLLDQAGLIRALVITGGEGFQQWSVFHLTWQGHDFLDTIRNETTSQRQRSLSPVKRK